MTPILNDFAEVETCIEVGLCHLNDVDDDAPDDDTDDDRYWSVIDMLIDIHSDDNFKHVAIILC